jgi:hypothetical protein
MENVVPATPEIEYFIKRQKELELELKLTYERWNAINIAIQENKNSLTVLSKMFLERQKASESSDAQPMDTLEAPAEVSS